MIELIKFLYRTPKHSYGLFKCQCGKEFERRIRKENLSKSANCGCTPSQLSHGHERNRKKSPELSCWQKIKERCSNPNNKDYINYGGRGIIVAKEWQEDFLIFLKDMGSRPSNKHSIDRIDVNGNYCKENCRWATKLEQANNTRANVFIEFNGRRQTQAQWLRELGIKRHQYNHQRKYGRDLILEALSG